MLQLLKPRGPRAHAPQEAVMRSWHTYLEKSLSSNEDSAQPKNDDNNNEKKSTSQKEKGDKLNIFKIENFCASVGIIKWKDNPQEITSNIW